jgi:hypothetical protein
MEHQLPEIRQLSPDDKKRSAYLNREQEQIGGC